MKKSTKAFMLSALVFPGTGHLYLKKYPAGLALVGASCVALYFFMVDIIKQATALSEQILNGTAQANMESITALMAQHSGDAGQMNTTMIAMLALWIIGIVDCYRIGRTLDKQMQAATEQRSRRTH